MSLNLKVMCILAVSALIIPLGITDADAEPSANEEYYCYTYNLAFIYGGGTVGDITVTWYAEGYDQYGIPVSVGQIEPYPSADNGWRVKFDPEDVKKCSYVYVTQEVRKDNEFDRETFKVIILAVPENGSYTVTFFDGYSGAAVGVSIIDTTGYVEVGGNIVTLPDNPERDGYSFAGWFVGADLNERFDPTKPVTSDVDVYAKWTETPKIPVDTTVYILLGIVVLLAAILVVVLIRMKKQRT